MLNLNVMKDQYKYELWHCVSTTCPEVYVPPKTQKLQVPKRESTETLRDYHVGTFSPGSIRCGFGPGKSHAVMKCLNTLNH